jgi:hypothetical protein
MRNRWPNFDEHYANLVKNGFLKDLSEQEQKALVYRMEDEGIAHAWYETAEGKFEIHHGDIPGWAYERNIQQMLDDTRRHEEPNPRLIITSRIEGENWEYQIIAESYPSQSMSNGEWLPASDLPRLKALVTGYNREIESFRTRVAAHEARYILPIIEQEKQALPEDEVLLHNRLLRREKRYLGAIQAEQHDQAETAMLAVAERYPDLKLSFGYIGNIEPNYDDRLMMIFIEDANGERSNWGRCAPDRMHTMLEKIRAGMLDAHIMKTHAPATAPDALPAPDTGDTEQKRSGPKR